jgi:glycerol-3-phosphate dehydrogenase subunit B
LRLAVIGGGAAGTAAAWAARRNGLDVTVFFDRAGATSLYSGALDAAPWSAEPPALELSPNVIAFATAVDSWLLGAKPCRVATHEGVVRPARGRDAALLDLEPLAGKSIGVVDLSLDDWDAPLLAHALGGSPWAVRTGARFVPTVVPGVVDERDFARSNFDVALLHDDSGRVSRFAECLQKAGASVDAWLVGPWLGSAPGAAEKLRGIARKPCGETTSPPGGPAGARFDAARDALFSATGVHVRREYVDSIQRRGSRWLPLSLTSGATANDSGFDAVVLAIGGLAGGGILLDEGEAPAKGLVPSVRAPVTVGFDDRDMHQIASVHGVDFSALGPAAFERLGILNDRQAIAGVAALFVAGDCAVERPRTVLEAARAGIAAVERALDR